MFTCRRTKREKVNWSPFCDCVAQTGRSTVLKCSCGEEDEGWVEWAWDPGDQGSAVSNPHGAARFIGRGFAQQPSLASPILLMGENREVMFHPCYSSGTAAIRGEHFLEPGMHHYWEVKILTPLYGTDMMVGVGTSAVNLRKNRFKYCSPLGEDNESWGFSYNGNIQHGGHKNSYGYPFGLGSIVGVHVDLWHGRLEFYLNRKPLGVAFTNLHGKALFPMASSTAAKSGVRLIHASSHPHSLLFSCAHALGIASHSTTRNQSSKRPCLDNKDNNKTQDSVSQNAKFTDSIAVINSTYSVGTPTMTHHNLSKNHTKHFGTIASSSPISSTTTEESGKGYTNTIQNTRQVGCVSDFQSHIIEFSKSETDDSSVASSKSSYNRDNNKSQNFASQNSKLTNRIAVIRSTCSLGHPTLSTSNLLRIHHKSHFGTTSSSSLLPANPLTKSEESGAVNIQQVGCVSDFENHVMGCSKSETVESSVEASRSLGDKLQHSMQLLTKSSSSGNLNEESSVISRNVDSSSSNKNSETYLSSDNHSGKSMPSSAKSDPFILTLLRDEEEESFPQLDITCARKRKKQPSCNSVEHIWEIPGLRTKVECSFWWLLGTRRGKDVLAAGVDVGTSHHPLIMVDDEDDWARGTHRDICKSNQGENLHRQNSDGSMSRACQERLCLMCHPVI